MSASVAVLAAVPVLATPAAAEIGYAVPSSWSYIDLSSPLRSFDQGDAPVGSWRDEAGRFHFAAKSYFTFDLTPYQGGRVQRVTVSTRETSVNDCTKPRTTQLWVTDQPDHLSWLHQPALRSMLPGPGAAPGCVSSYLEWDAAAAVNAAVQAGKRSITFALRLPIEHQLDPAYGRHHRNSLTMYIDHNEPPYVPTNLSNGGKPCAEGSFFGNTDLSLSAFVDDPNHDHMDATFAIWPVDRPDQRRELTAAGTFGSFSTVVLRQGTLADGVTYQWAVRATDRTEVPAASAWSEPCRFTVDMTPPGLPTVSSTDYPENPPEPIGGPGVPGRFTFDANGSADVVGFRYGAFGEKYVAADRLGGSATVDFAPDWSGPFALQVRSVDRAGNASETRSYGFFVRDNTPTVTSPTGEGGTLGELKRFDFSPGPSGAVAYDYRLNFGPVETIQANPDGTASISVEVAPEFNDIMVWSVSATGVRSSPNWFFFYIEVPGS
ncbi:hypothetical protein [Actinophytocola sp.]|uniref:hypothetical protein n=1 Tax=Actinophytocola sp. TaxID=1872138 RepID=UPI002D8000A5|nr:hypothetical protein [Actinophytocola sp.]HET9142857.1 hypothetical protein [Actinophytocola sp.]